jgi:molybdate transport system substrate-binding protein
VTLAALICAAALCACGDSGSSASTALNVSAASSLKKPLSQFAADWKQTGLNLEFAGSDKIAAAIEAGRKPDVVVLAGKDVPQQLFAKGLISKPEAVAANRLVIATRKGGLRVTSLSDLGKPGIKVALGAASVPVGKYADRVLAALPETTRNAILANVRTREPDAAGVTGKLVTGTVDAAIVYRTDVLSANGKLIGVTIPSALKPTVKYFAAGVSHGKHPDQSAKVLESLKSGMGHEILIKDGFLPPSAG